MASTREESALSDSANAHARNHGEYSYRLPTPPRIVVPPPNMTIELPSLYLRPDLASMDPYDMTFLDGISLYETIQKNTVIEWTYERRRQAQAILPWLYLGPMMAAKDKEFLARENITMVLAVRAREKSLMGALQVAAETCQEVATIEAATSFELIGQFPGTTKMINSHVARIRQHSIEQTGQPTLGKVLVFCESGNEKSAAVVAAYLLEMLLDFNHVHAMQVCQGQRFCVNFDDNIKNILRSYWDILQAKRSVAKSIEHSPQQGQFTNGQNHAGSLQAPTASKQKRTIDQVRSEDEDEDMEMRDSMDASDALRFAGRDLTPFANRM